MDNKIKSAIDAAGTAADYSARATYQRGYDAGVEEAKKAEASLDAGREVLRDMWSALNAVRAAGPMPYGYSLDHVSAVVEMGKELLGDDARPWMTDAARLLVAPYQQRVVDEQARADAAESRAEVAIARACEAVEAREWALGVQVVAQAERLKLATETIEALRERCLLGCNRCGCQHPACHWCREDADIRATLAAWDAVPGDDKEKT